MRVGSHADSALDLLNAQCDLSRSRIKKAMSSGAVWLRRGQQLRQLRRSSAELQKDDRITLYFSETILNEVAPEPTLFADEQDYSVWVKPRGAYSQGTRYGDHCAMTRLVESVLNRQGSGDQRPALLVHRLDRYTSGLMLLAHSKQAAASLSALFRERTISKHYMALVHGQLQLKSNELVIDSAIDEKPACSRVIASTLGTHCSLVEMRIDTGRKHQVRKHLALQGYPVVGDLQYGDTSATSAVFKGMDLQLTASQLSFLCPISQTQKCYTLSDQHFLEMRSALLAG